MFQVGSEEDSAPGCPVLCPGPAGSSGLAGQPGSDCDPHTGKIHFPQSSPVHRAGLRLTDVLMCCQGDVYPELHSEADRVSVLFSVFKIKAVQMFETET